MTEFKGNGLPLLIGSLPITDHEEAVGLVFHYTPDIPLWVQLPAYPQEGMIRQFLEGFPGLVQEKDRLFVEPSAPGFEEALLSFYEEVLSVTEADVPLDGTRFVLTPSTATGFFALLNRIESLPRSPAAVKGQITGPVTLATGLTDQNRRAVFYDERLRDVVVKTVALKARWQAEKLSQGGRIAIIFIDEPGLAGFGTSAFISISREDVSLALSEVIDAIHQGGGLAGIHVCANTDWSLILDSAADILSFDAYGYFERLALYEKPLKAFYDQGRIVAWGIVPTSGEDEIEREDASSLVERWEGQVGRIACFGVDREVILAQSLITPSCGTGSLTQNLAVRVLELTRDVSRMVREQV